MRKQLTYELAPIPPSIPPIATLRNRQQFRLQKEVRNHGKHHRNSTTTHRRRKERQDEAHLADRGGSYRFAGRRRGWCVLLLPAKARSGSGNEGGARRAAGV